MSLAVISLSPQGALLADTLAAAFQECDVYLHESVSGFPSARPFSGIVELSAEIFQEYEGLVYIVPCGVVVRAIAPCLRHKTVDPAVVVVDVGGRFAVSLLSGHEGGANELAMKVGNILSAEPVISTTTEALKTLIVGIGCRRGIEAETIVHAVKTALAELHSTPDQVRLLASADVKAAEEGLLSASRMLGIPLRLISSDEIRTTPKDFQHSDFVATAVNLPAVAEPAALLAGRRTTLVLRKKIFDGVTVAIAKESCLWSE